MKKTSLIFSLLGIILLLSNCQTTNDSSLTLDSFKEKATIKGNVFYNLGQNLSANNYIIEQRLAAKGKIIYLDVAASEYQPGSTGLITFQSVIDSSGNYSFTIPVKTQGITNATLRLEQFTANRKLYDKISNGLPQFTSQPAIFSCSSAITISKGVLLVKNLNYSYSPMDIPNNYTDYIKFTGTVNIAYESAFKEGSIKAASGKTVEVAVNYPELGKTLNFGTTVDQSGNYNIMIPVLSRKNPITASFQAVGFYSTDYTHFVTSNSRNTLTGIYNAVSQTVTTNSGLNDNIDYAVKPMIMLFNPDVIPSTFTYYLAGWINGIINTDPSKTYYPITIKGSVFAAYEKSYLIGDYLPVSQKTDTITIRTSSVTQTYIVATDDGGNFTLSVLLPSNKMDITITEKPEKFGITNYSHYLADGTTIQLSGWYQSNYYDIINKTITLNEFSSVYNIDNIYKVFTPIDAANTKEWYTNLVGWYQISGKKGTVNVTGGIKEAIEGAPLTSKPTAWTNPTWAIAPNQPFTIIIAGQTFKGITNSSGQYSISYPVNQVVDPNTTTNLVISLTSGIAKVSNFNHYSDINASPVAIQGSYSGTVSSASFSVVNGTCLIKDCYMFFTPSTVPTGWSLYTWTAN